MQSVTGTIYMLLPPHLEDVVLVEGCHFGTREHAKLGEDLEATGRGSKWIRNGERYSWTEIYILSPPYAPAHCLLVQGAPCCPIIVPPQIYMDPDLDPHPPAHCQPVQGAPSGTSR